MADIPKIDEEMERRIILSRFFGEKEYILKLAKELGLPKWKGKDSIGYDEREEAEKAILETNQSRFSQALDGIEASPYGNFPWFRGRYYHIEYDKENGRIKVHELPAEEFHNEVLDSLRLIADDPDVQALLRGIIESGFYYKNDAFGGSWSKIVGAGRKFYEGDKFFWPSTKSGILEQIPGVRSYKSGSGREFYLASELAPIIWEELNRIEEAKSVSTPPPETKIPIELARRKPKFDEIFEEVEVTEEDVQEFERILSENDALDYWKDYIAPGVKFRNKGKIAILCMLASPEDKHGTKGRTNAIIYGTPGAGKTEFKNFLVDKFGAYGIDGSRLSKADLTYNKTTGEEGLLVRAHKGLAVIEEADKMDPESIGAALTSLGETGKIEIRDMELPAEVRGIMLSNFDSPEEIKEELSEEAFNRFEFVLKFEELDKKELDKTLDWHYEFFRKPKPKANASYLKKYLKWVRDFEPEIAGLGEIKEFKWENIDAIENVREGISIMNVAYTIARLNHRDVTLDDYKRAFELVTSS